MYSSRLKYYIIVLITISFSKGYNQLTIKKPSLFQSLFNKRDSENYESGYVLNKLLFNQQFSHPITRIPIEIRYGIGFDGKTAGSFSEIDTNSFVQDQSKIKYAENVETRINQKFENIFGSSLEIDFGLVNIPYYLTKTSWLNVLTGFSYRQSKLFYPAEVPYDEWTFDNSNWSDKFYFSPALKEYFLTTHLQYQPFNNWYFNIRYSYGLASAKFYSPDREVTSSVPSGKGTSAAGALGVRFILDPGKLNRFTVGLDLRRSYTKIHTINDPKDITPIKSFVLPNWGLYFTLSAFYGGKKTSGDIAKSQYYKKDYINSLDTFKKFISEHPKHSNRYRAENYIKKCEFKIPYQIMQEGIEYEKEAKTQKALEKYIFARSQVKNDSIISMALNKRINQIAILWLVEAENLLNKGNYYQAYSLVKLVSEFSEKGMKELRRFKSWVVLSEGISYQNENFIGKAMKTYSEALKLNPDLIFEVKSLQYKAGIQMVNLANKSDEIDEIQLAIYSLEYAKELSGGIGKKNEELLADLKKKIQLFDYHKTQSIINERMDRAREYQNLARTEKLKIGQTIPEVQNLLGDPHEKISSGLNQEQQLWIYFLVDHTLHLTFDNYQLFKIEQI